MTENFQKILDGDGLAFYPDWPVAGFYDRVVSAIQSLINGSKTGAEAMSDLATAYEEGKAEILDA